MSQQEEALKKLLAILSPSPQEKVDAKHIKYSEDTQSIIVPKGMPMNKAGDECYRIWEEEETDCVVLQQYPGWHWKDVLYSLKVSALETFGWVSAESTPKDKPMYVNITTDIINGKPVYENCFYGTIRISAWEMAKCQVDISRYTGVVSIGISCKQRYKDRANAFTQFIETQLLTNSIYRGKSIRVVHGSEYGDLEFEIIEIKEDPNIILNPELQRDIERNVIYELGLDKEKRVYLFKSGYGNGKTATILSIGKAAISRGMTFFYVKNANLFTSVLTIAPQYGHCGVFLEDIDEISSGDGRGASDNDILNKLDGFDTKNVGLKVYLTTNHAEKLNPALRRPGRLDYVFSIENPSPNTAVKILQKYLQTSSSTPIVPGQGSHLPGTENIDWNKVKESLPDTCGAVIAEMGKRLRQWAAQGETLETKLVLEAIESLAGQISLMAEPVVTDDSLSKAIRTIGKELFKDTNIDWDDDDD